MNIVDRITYFYIKHIKRWMECPVCHKTMTYSKEYNIWSCKSCGYSLEESDFLDDFVFWFCDGCGTYLNIQEGFDRKGTSWICTECGFDNCTTFENIKGECKDCGVLIDNPNATICPSCKIKRMEKAKAVLDATSELCYSLSDSLDTESRKSDSYPYIRMNDNDYEEDDVEEADDDTTSANVIRCSYCGNTNEQTLWNEGDTVYCSMCHHRTSTETGSDDSVECPFCHRMRDRKAMYCRYCNDATWQCSTAEEYEEIDRDLKSLGL